MAPAETVDSGVGMVGEGVARAAMMAAGDPEAARALEGAAAVAATAE